MQSLSNQGSRKGGRGVVNPIQTRGTDYANHTTTCPPPRFLDGAPPLQMVDRWALNHIYCRVLYWSQETHLVRLYTRYYDIGSKSAKNKIPHISFFFM